MGAWGAGPFENDGALDWLEAGGSDLPALVRQTLSAVANTRGYLQADQGQEAVAAAALVARSLPGGRSSTLISVPPDDAGGPFPVDDELRRLGLLALERVQSKASELVELWSGDAVYEATLEQLRMALIR